MHQRNFDNEGRRGGDGAWKHRRYVDDGWERETRAAKDVRQSPMMVGAIEALAEAHMDAYDLALAEAKAAANLELAQMLSQGDLMAASYDTLGGLQIYRRRPNQPHVTRVASSADPAKDAAAPKKNGRQRLAIAA